MAISPLIWFPIGSLVGRRTTYLTAVCLLFLCSIGAALAPTIAVFISIWVVGGTTGVVFLVSGQTVIADIFEPTVQGRAVGLFLGSHVSAQMIAPLTGGILATYTTWRAIYGLQAGMSLIGFILAFCYVPKDVQKSSQGSSDRGSKARFRTLIKLFSPFPVFKILRYPDILLSNISCGLLSFNLYGILSAVRFAISERFDYSSPHSSSLFLLAPGTGFVIGSIVGGVLSDRTVKQYIVKREGIRLPRDRLRAGLITMLLILPGGNLVLGWSLQEKVGGMALPAAGAFAAGFGLMASFSSLNTYAAEVLPGLKREIISCKYIFQYAFSAGAVASRLPTLSALGVGWAFTITAIAAAVSGVIVLGVISYKPSREAVSDSDRSIA
ncbi:major facilitator superfamily transporter [Dactylonectria estremocensis]|uniref:Major facilitator superfamily transporter n=1 Tax=Dactylonectria estremocensis TaxID=1079267 RepID=A0A9P9ILE0_9HYPO|nr:major facilitator superfamily transporter [Dactylonectria estremocensis]